VLRNWKPYEKLDLNHNEVTRIKKLEREDKRCCI